MDKGKLLKELHEKVNAWFEEKPQRPIAQFMLDTMLPCLEAVEHSVHLDKVPVRLGDPCPKCGGCDVQCAECLAALCQ
jgi:hypothetical protein